MVIFEIESPLDPILSGITRGFFSYSIFEEESNLFSNVAAGPSHLHPLCQRSFGDQSVDSQAGYSRLRELVQATKTVVRYQSYILIVHRRDNELVARSSAKSKHSSRSLATLASAVPAHYTDISRTVFLSDEGIDRCISLIVHDPFAKRLFGCLDAVQMSVRPEASLSQECLSLNTRSCHARSFLRLESSIEIQIEWEARS